MGNSVILLVICWSFGKLMCHTWYWRRWSMALDSLSTRAPTEEVTWFQRLFNVSRSASNFSAFSLEGAFSTRSLPVLLRYSRFEVWSCMSVSSSYKRELFIIKRLVMSSTLVNLIQSGVNRWTPTSERMLKRKYNRHTKNKQLITTKATLTT